jgi:hypothetical protein
MPSSRELPKSESPAQRYSSGNKNKSLGWSQSCDVLLLDMCCITPKVNEYVKKGRGIEGLNSDSLYRRTGSGLLSMHALTAQSTKEKMRWMGWIQAGEVGRGRGEEIGGMFTLGRTHFDPSFISKDYAVFVCLQESEKYNAVQPLHCSMLPSLPKVLWPSIL